MLHEVGIDILDLGTERLTWRRLQVLLAHLPQDSHTVRAVMGEAARWGDREHLLATLVDVQAQANWMFAVVNSKQPPEMPKPLQRPGMPDPVKRIGGKRSYTMKEVDEIRARMTPMPGGGHHRS